jgi:NADPH-dependent curcumin reductase CurA
MYLRVLTDHNRRMRKPEAKSYSPPFTLGEPQVTLCSVVAPSHSGSYRITGFGITEVIKSNDPSVKPGDRLYGGVSFQQYSVVNLKLPFPFNYRVIKNEENLPWSLYVGVLGMPGEAMLVPLFFGQY